MSRLQEVFQFNYTHFIDFMDGDCKDTGYNNLFDMWVDNPFVHFSKMEEGHLLMEILEED